MKTQFLLGNYISNDVIYSKHELVVGQRFEMSRKKQTNDARLDLVEEKNRPVYVKKIPFIYVRMVYTAERYSFDQWLITEHSGP